MTVNPCLVSHWVIEFNRKNERGKKNIVQFAIIDTWVIV